MIDLEKEFEKHKENLMNTDLDNYRFKSVFTSIPEDIDALIKETSNGKIKAPNLVILSVVNLTKDNPCGVCREAYDQLIQWSLDSGYVADGKVKILIVADEFDKKKIWQKLGVDFSQAPRHYIFDSNFRLHDVVDGVMNGSYIETFYGKLIK